MTRLWIVGQWREGSNWEFQGVFSTEEKARAACRDHMYFLAPALLDLEVPAETEEWPHAYYPGAAS